MDLKEFTSPLPKPWLTINAASVHVGPGSGGAASSVVYSQLGTTTIANTTALLSLSSNAAATGSLTLPPLPVGAVIRMTAKPYLEYQSGGGFQVFLRLNGATVFAPNVSALVNASTIVEFSAEITVLSAGFAIGNFGFQVGTQGKVYAPVGAQTPFAFNSAVGGTFDFAHQFGTAAANNSLTCTQYYVELLNAN